MQNGAESSKDKDEGRRMISNFGLRIGNLGIGIWELEAG